MKLRADVAAVEAGLAPSREKAQAMIMAGEIYAGEKKITKSSEQIEDISVLRLHGETDSFASRGGHKLEKAIKAFHADVTGLVAMDIGAAAGGFTDVLLRNGASHVYAIDVGYGQLEWKIRNDERVTVMERTNARTLTADMFPLHPTLTVMDVSFISIRLILPVAAQIMGSEGRFLTLIKPQFEAGREYVGKKGVVRDKAVHLNVLKQINEFVSTMGWHAEDMTFSPITGPAGNIEFLADLQPGEKAPLEDSYLREIVQQAHETLTK